MNGRRVLVTGATAGIGKVAARELKKLGAEVVIVGRNAEKTQRVASELGVEFLLADLSSMASVKRLGADFLSRYGTLHVLLNNAGAVNTKLEKTVDGYERTFATNHLAYFSLTNDLLPALEKGAQQSGKKSRIVNVSSNAHRSGPMQFDNLNAERGYITFGVYGRSKLANILFTRELAHRLEGKPVTANSLHPGFVASDFLSKGGIYTVIKPIAYLFALSEEDGAKTSIYLASSPEVDDVTGKYFVKCKVAKPRAFAEDDLAARRLWDESERMIGAALAQAPAANNSPS